VHTLADLKNVTACGAVATDPSCKFSVSDGRKGFYFALGPSEQMLRDPLVFQAIAYYKTNTGVTAPSACTLGTTKDQIYAINACTTVPANGGATGADKVAWTGSTDGGGGIYVYTPKSGAPVVSPFDQKTPTGPIVPPKPGGRSLRLYLWWRG
jgi:hypothetical protein